MKYWLVFVLAAAACMGGCSTQINYPNSIEAIEDPMFADGEVAYLNGDYRLAISKFYAYLREHGDSSLYAADAYLWIGKSHVALGDFEAAEASFRMGTFHPRNSALKAQCLEGMGDCKRARHKYPEALSLYKEALETERVKVDAGALQFKIALAQLRNSRWHDGKTDLKEFLAAYPQHKWAPRAKAILEYPFEYFAIQTGTFDNNQNAEQEKRRAETLKLPAVVTTVRDGNAVRYVVLVGRYKDFNDALRALPAVQKAFSDAFIVP